MSIVEHQNLNSCKKLHGASVMTEWREAVTLIAITTAVCGIPTRTPNQMSCRYSMEGPRLLEIAINSGNVQLQEALRVGVCTTPEEMSRPRKLEQAVKSRIAQRTGGRIQMLEVRSDGRWRSYQGQGFLLLPQTTCPEGTKWSVLISNPGEARTFWFWSERGCPWRRSVK